MGTKNHAQKAENHSQYDSTCVLQDAVYSPVTSRALHNSATQTRVSRSIFSLKTFHLHWVWTSSVLKILSGGQTPVQWIQICSGSHLETIVCHIQKQMSAGKKSPDLRSSVRPSQIRFSDVRAHRFSKFFTCERWDPFDTQNQFPIFRPLKHIVSDPPCTS